MVKKSCKRGVHSGNTLRASSSLYKRRYHGDSCIVRHVQTGSEEVEDSYLRDHDVLYSLNKKGRWLLPALLVNNIVKGLTLEGSAATTPVSFLQRHKLKRQANCVAVASTWGRCRRRPVTGKNGLYFNGLSVLDAGRGRRRRQRRRARGQAAREARAAEASAEAGLQKEQPNTQAQPEPEVRYEAFLPCSASSSISHNPKYILKPEGSDFGVFPETKVQSKKSSRGKARRRKTTLQWMDAAMEMEALDFQEDLDDNDEEGDIDLYNKEEAKHDMFGVTDARISLEELIKSAEKARDLCDRPDQRVVGKEPRRRCHTSCGETERPGKVIHVDRDEASGDGAAQAVASSPSVSAAPISPEVESVPVRVILPDCDVMAGELSRLYEGRYLEAACQPRRFILDISEELEARARSWENLGSVRAKDLDLTAYLVFTYDGFYDAGLSVYGVQMQVKTRLQRVKLETLWELSVTSVAAVLEAALAYVSMLGAQVLVLREAESYIAESTDGSLTFQHVRHARREVMDTFHPEEAVSKVVRDLTLSEVAEVKHTTRCSEVNKRPEEIRGTKEKPDRDYSSPSDSEDDNFTLESWDLLPDCSELLPMGAGLTATTFSNEATSADLFPDEEPQFCNICFVEVGTGIPDAPGVTWLRSCAHVFCNDCWRRHLSDRVTSGAGKLLCPEFRCETEVDAGTVLSLLSLSQVRQWRRRQVELSVTRTPGQTWCPNPRCGRVLRLRGRGLGDTGGVQAVSVACVCGWTTCLACGREAHWPATCLQERRYRERLAARGDDELDGNADFSSKSIIRGTHCPKCNEFIEKLSGCNYMRCRCGAAFCHHCGVPYEGHRCRIGLRRRITPLDKRKRVQVGHVGRPDEEATKGYLEALHHRSMRRPQQLSTVWRNATTLAARLKTLQAKGMDVGLDLLKEEGFPASPTSRLKPFLSRLLQLRLEMLHVIEHTAILLESNHTVVGRSRRQARKLVEQMSWHVEAVDCLLGTETQEGLLTALSQLRRLQQRACAGLRALVQALQQAEAC